MSWWPRQLWRQTALMVLIVVIITQVLSLSLLAHFRMQIVKQQGIELARGYVVMVRSALTVMSPEQLAQRLIEQKQQMPINNQASIKLIYQPHAQASDVNMPVGILLLYHHLQQEWGNDNVQIAAKPQAALLIRVQGDWWLQMLTTNNTTVSLFTPIFIWLNIGLLLLAGIIAVFVRHLVQPLLQLEKEVAIFAEGKTVENPLSLNTNTSEVYRLAHSIHQMMHSLRSHEQERRTMLAGLPHDIRAPLTRLKLRLALLDHNDSAAFEQDIRAIEHIAEQFIGYLRGLDAQNLKIECFNLNELLGELVSGYQQTGHNLQYIFIDEPIFVKADALMLRRAVDNLIQNALHHGAEPIRLSLSTHQLMIEDSGTGIAPQLRDKACQPFSQLESERGNQGQVGLGLAVVKQILTAHQINMTLAESDLGGLKVEMDLTRIINSLDED